MARQFTIRNKTFNYPSPGESPGWGEDATDWAEEVTDVLSTLSSAGDIPVTSATILNNQSSAANVPGLLFDPSVVRGAEIPYTITRTGTVSAAPVTLVEKGQIQIVYNGSSWELVRASVGDAEVTFSITNAGQFQYVSNDISSGAGVTGYSGNVKFEASTIISQN
jgi:hypothetical protein